MYTNTNTNTCTLTVIHVPTWISSYLGTLHLIPFSKVNTNRVWRSTMYKGGQLLSVLAVPSSGDNLVSTPTLPIVKNTLGLCWNTAHTNLSVVVVPLSGDNLVSTPMLPIVKNTLGLCCKCNTALIDQTSSHPPTPQKHLLLAFWVFQCSWPDFTFTGWVIILSDIVVCWHSKIEDFFLSDV